MDGDGSKFNLSSATTVPSYRPSEITAKYAVRCGPADAPASERLALVIPALHEAANLGALLSRIRNALHRAPIEWEVIVVDDHSLDGTEQIVSDIARHDPRIRLLVRRGQRGLSGAILHGWQHTDATILGAIDADGQHPPETLPEMLAAIRAGQDVAIGSRYAAGGRSTWNPLRRLVSIAAILAARPLQTKCLPVRDPLSGFFLVRRECVEDVAFQISGFKLLLEILVCGRIRSVTEIPIAFGRRHSGRSKVTARVAWHYATLLARLYRIRLATSRRTQAVSGD